MFGGRRPIECVFIDFLTSATPGSVQLFEDLDFDVGGGILVAVHWLSSNPRTLSSATIDGVSATEVATATGDVGGGTVGVSLIAANLPAGGIGDVSVTFSGSVDNCEIGAYRLRNFVSLTPSSTPGELGWNSSAPNTRSTSADVLAGGLYLVASSVFHSGGTTVLSGVINSYDFDFDSANVYHANGGFEVVEADTIGKTATVTKSGGAANMTGGLIAVPFR